MIEKLVFASILILTASSACASDIIARAESTELRRSDGKVVPRVERDSRGNVVSLRLDGMEITPDDVGQLGRLPHLRRLGLFRTNVSDREVAQLEGFQSLEHLNLTGTQITDDAIGTILELKKLKSVCLGNVDVTPEAVARLQELNRSRERSGDERLRWGYSQRKQESP